MKLLSEFPFRILIPVCILMAAILICVIIVNANRVTYKSEPFTESTDILSNPYQGFYHIIGYTLTDGDSYIGTDLSLADSYSGELVLLEINLKNFRNSEISDNGLSQLRTIFSAWSHSPSDTGIILRFLYDWDGVALATEPESLDLILTHMDQVSTVVNEYRDSIYIMQGIFVGNWAEMHHSNYLDAQSVNTLIRKLHSVIDPAIYLSVRTPAFWRLVNNMNDVPDPFPAFGSDGSLAGRLGLFNDGILGSESDLGTYGASSRASELKYQNRLCAYVPNGGEVIFNQTLSEVQTSVSDLRTMHVSYLNADYDTRVLDKWRNSTWIGNDAFKGCDGLHYIQAHLGYRYLIRSSRLKKTGILMPKWKLSVTLENTGFANTLKPFSTTVLLKNAETGECTAIPLSADLRKLRSGEKKAFTANIPVINLENGNYEVYLTVTDETSGRMILLANENSVTSDGYLLGRLVK